MGNLVKDGPGTLSLTAATNSLTGTTLVDSGTLVATAANLATPVTLANNTNLTFYQATAGTLSTVSAAPARSARPGPDIDHRLSR